MLLARLFITSEEEGCDNSPPTYQIDKASSVGFANGRKDPL